MALGRNAHHPSMPAVMTTILFVIPPTPGTAETTSNAALLSYWCSTSPFTVSQPGVDGDLYAVVRYIWVGHQGLDCDAADLIVVPVVAQIHPELVLDVAHARHRARDLDRGSALRKAPDAAAQRHRAGARGHRNLPRMRDPGVIRELGLDVVDDGVVIGHRSAPLGRDGFGAWHEDERVRGDRSSRDLRDCRRRPPFRC
jgi:hypothetical protein